MNREELLKRILDGRSALDAALAQFNESDLTEPSLPNGWSVKDVIAHIGFWEKRIATLYEILVAGDVPKDTVTDETVDALNARVFEENQLLPLGIIRLNEEESYQAIVEVAENATEDELFDARRFDWTRGRPFYHFLVENTYEHYADHVPDLLAIAGQDT